ncbi:hypothetical protein LCGC14_0665160 [marine sediment metagenome]|uniref:Uncharacterized protein n=1 Tax=marine sediment metagenome TaxID=412755 RepID=A0A0F9RCL0_9ZZZZ
MVAAIEGLVWKARYKVEKYHGDLLTEQDRYGIEPYEVIEGEGNLLLNEGINELFVLLCGSGGTKFDNSNARLGVGNSNSAAVATQTGLLGGSTLFKAMEATYPLNGTDQKATFRSSFGSSEGNFAWEEWTVDNGAGANKNLNRKVTVLGTKVSGTTWVFTVEVSLS